MARSLHAGLLPATLLFLTLACGGSGSSSGQTAPLAPAGSERLFLLDQDGLWEVKDGGRKAVIARPDKAFIYDAAVSPDGTDVALSIQDEPKQTPNGYDFGVDLHVALDGGELREIATHDRLGEVLSRPNWLPGGAQIIFAVLGRDATGAADLRIERIDVATGVRERIIEDASEPALSLDASSLAYVAIDPKSGQELITLRDMATGASKPLLPDTQVMVNVANIAWSPDGARIAFGAADPISLRAAGARLAAGAAHPTLRDVWVVNADGSGLRRITEIADATLSLAWSADSQHIYAYGDTGFWRVDANDGALRQLGEGTLAGRVQTLVP